MKSCEPVAHVNLSRDPNKQKPTNRGLYSDLTAPRQQVHPQFGANFDSRFFSREAAKNVKNVKNVKEKGFVGSPPIPQKARVSASRRLRAKFRVLCLLRALCCNSPPNGGCTQAA